MRSAIPIDDASRQNKRPPGVEHAPRAGSIASKCSSSRAKCSTALLMTTSAIASANVHGLDRLRAKVRLGGRWREARGKAAHGVDRARIGVHGGHVVAFAQEIDEVAAGAAAGVEHAHARRDAAAQQLIEEIDVDVAELIVEGAHGQEALHHEDTVDTRIRFGVRIPSVISVVTRSLARRGRHLAAAPPLPPRQGRCRRRWPPGGRARARRRAARRGAAARAAGARHATPPRAVRAWPRAGAFFGLARANLRDALRQSESRAAPPAAAS